MFRVCIQPPKFVTELTFTLLIVVDDEVYFFFTFLELILTLFDIEPFYDLLVGESIEIGWGFWD